MDSTAPSFPLASLLVVVGGGGGAWLRYALWRLVAATIGTSAASGFPWATLITNVTGSAAMGLLAGWLASRGDGTAGWSFEHWRLLLGVGALGGFTTFSAFSLEAVQMAQRGSLGLAAAYVAASLVGGFAGLAAGLAAMRGLA